LILVLVIACGGGDPPDLAPYPNPFGEDDPLWAPQPRRENPLEVVVAGSTAWVTLQGSVDEPGDSVARVDLTTFDVDRVRVGSSPTGLALHPDGRWLVVFNRFSAYASVVDVERRREVARLPSRYYATEGVFAPDGRSLWVTNRWTDTVEVWPIHADDAGLAMDGAVVSIPVGANPRDVAISDDGATVAVAALTGLTVSLIDTGTRSERLRVDLGAPPNGVVFVDDFIVVPTLSRSTHHLPYDGADSDHDGIPGDGTPNVNFQDLQNEIAVVDARTGEEVYRATSDTICCLDYRDVDPRDSARHGDLLPDAETWIVGGALPEQIARDGDGVVVTYSASDQWQRFDVEPSGQLVAGPVFDTSGYNPHGVAVAGDRVVIAHRLGETLGVYDRDGAPLAQPVVGDVEGGPFPATDAEIGELVNFVTAPFTVDGDQACSMCHREGGNLDKAFAMPLSLRPGTGLRMTPAYRGLADTRPWFFEAAMDENNFKPVLNEFARIENFCCSDYTLFPSGAPPGCAADPPPECAGPNPGSLDGFGATRGAPFAPERPTDHPTRDRLFESTMEARIGRRTSFGDSLYFEDPLTGAREPVSLGFDQTTRALGIFLLVEPRLLPNPNPGDRAAVRRGRALFERSDVGCSLCHPAPTFAVSSSNNPAGLPLRMGPVVTPNRSDDGINLDLLADGFLTTFPDGEMETCDEVCGVEACDADAAICDDVRNVKFGAPSLRGLWDRAPSMLHHGRARGLREVLCTPGHPALLPGEVGFNERDGVPDTHGATSHLTPAEIDDLIQYLVTL
jgi:hypothetical protein